MKTNIIEQNHIHQPVNYIKKNYSFSQENTSLGFDKIYDSLIKPIEVSPLMFNFFHWVVNNKEQRLVYSSGVRSILGYSDSTLTMDKIQNFVHPNYRTLINTLAFKVFELFKNENYRTYSKEAHFCIQFPIQHINGTFLLVQQNCTIVTTDKDYNPVIVYYRFENLGKYMGFPVIVKPRVCFNVGIYSADLEIKAETLLSKEVNNILIEHISLTNKQKEMLILLSQDKNINTIAKELNITVETLKVHSKNILSKAKTKISPMFTNAREVSLFLKEALVI
jgi:DNA-binding CsgD family transcriptional regulator